MGNSSINKKNKTNAFTLFYSVQALCKCHSNIAPINPQCRTTREAFLSLFHGQKNKGLERVRSTNKFTQTAIRRTKIHTALCLNTKHWYNQRSDIQHVNGLIKGPQLRAHLKLN